MTETLFEVQYLDIDGNWKPFEILGTGFSRTNNSDRLAEAYKVASRVYRNIRVVRYVTVTSSQVLSMVELPGTIKAVLAQDTPRLAFSVLGDK